MGSGWRGGPDDRAANVQDAEGRPPAIGCCVKGIPSGPGLSDLLLKSALPTICGTARLSQGTTFLLAGTGQTIGSRGRVTIIC
jgi:hypothetical protein